MKSTHRPWYILTAVIVAANCMFLQQLPVQQAAAKPVAGDLEKNFVTPPGAASSILPGLIYHPEGDAIVVRNGTRWDNRPLYCNAQEMTVMAGEMPGLSCRLGTLRVGVTRGDVRLQLEQFSERVARYRPGRMEWEVTDPKLPGLTVTMTATTVAKGDGFTARIRVKGAKAGDEPQWTVVNDKPVPVAGGFKIAKAVVSLSGNAPGSLVVPLRDDVPQDFAMVRAPEPLPATAPPA